MEEHQYGIGDFRHYMMNMTGPSHFPEDVQAPAGDQLSGRRRNLTAARLYEAEGNLAAVPRPPQGLHTSGGTTTGVVEMEGGCCGNNNGRWPRQETLTLLEIRSRLDSKFKETNQKAPLWHQVSRIMSEEHGYQRNGKICKDKFENLYKYYKKTKGGKAGRHDGKNYRFFRQLEALYGESSNNHPSASVSQPNHHHQKAFQSSTSKLSDNTTTTNNNNNSLSLSNYSSGFDDTCSSSFDDDDDDDASNLIPMENNNPASKRKKKKRSWKARIRDSIDAQMKKLMEKQEAWLEKMMKTIEQKDKERILREEEWRKEEAERVDREHKLWANERAWMEIRDSALMEALHKLTGLKELKSSSSSSDPEGLKETGNENGNHEIKRLIQLRTSMESRFQQKGGSSSSSNSSEEVVLWEEIAAKISSCFGYERTGLMCKEKWDSISNYVMRLNDKEDCSKKMKENSTTSFCNFQTSDHSSICTQAGAYCETNNSNNDSCIRFLLGDLDNLWESYVTKMNRG